MITQFKRFFLNPSGDRTKKATLNIILSFIFRGGSILFQFALVPLTINYMHAEKYGVWVTIYSLVSWVALLDIGIANGLKNNLSKSLSQNDYDAAKTYVSSAYVLISLFACIVIIIFFSANKFINWQSVFNSGLINERELTSVVAVVFVAFLVKFIIDIINIVAASFQHISVGSLLLFLSNLGLFIAMVILPLISKSNFLLVAVAFSIIPLIVSIGASFYLYYGKYKMVKPSIKFVDLNKSKGILSLGAKFFILQIATLIIFQTDNILIASLFNPKEVAVFNIIYRYYSSLIILFSIIISPYWTAFTEAYVKQEFLWLKSTVRRLIFIWLWSLVPLVLMLALAQTIIKLWVGNSIVFDGRISIAIFFYVAIFNWNSIYGSFLNGVGKIRVQIICVIVVGSANIPLILFLVKKLHFGAYAMPLANFVCLSAGAVLGYVQYKKIVNRTATGIWNI